MVRLEAANAFVFDLHTLRYFLNFYVEFKVKSEFNFYFRLVFIFRKINLKIQTFNNLILSFNELVFNKVLTYWKWYSIAQLNLKCLKIWGFTKTFGNILTEVWSFSNMYFSSSHWVGSKIWLYSEILWILLTLLQFQTLFFFE